MKPQVLLEGACLFTACLSLHLVIWRLKTPTRHVPALLAVFGPPAAAYLLARWLGGRGEPEELAAVALLHAALASAYMQTYPAAQALSPSLQILRLLHNRPGLTEAQIRSKLAHGSWVEDRLDDLLAAGLVNRRPDGRVGITPRGAALVPPFYWFRRFLGLARGRG